MRIIPQRPVTPKGLPKAKKSTGDRSQWENIRALGCIIANADCKGKTELHHPTGAGWGKKSKDEDVIPLCFNHHSAQTELGFGHSVHKGTRTFERNYGTQQELIKERNILLEQKEKSLSS